MNVGQATTAMVSRNSIMNVVTTDSAITANNNGRGILISTGVTNSTVTRNNVTGVRYTGTAGYGGKGLDINTGVAASNLTISNNFVSDIRGDSFNSLTGDSIVGIRILGATGGINLYNNSVNLGSGTFAGNSSGTLSAAFFADATVTGLDLRDNIFASNLDNTVTSTDKTYAVATAATTNALFTTINYNDYVVSGTPGFVGLLNGVDRLALANWQTASGQDVNSLTVDPLFTSAADLHISNMSPVINQGITIAGVTMDFDGDARDATPDIGADEIVVANTPPTITPVGVTRQEGSPLSNSTIANVTDLESGNGAVVVTVTTANPSNGVTISNIVNTGGVITADVVAACGAANATFTLQASDGTLTSTGTLNVTVTANTAPTLSYNNASVTSGGSIIASPATGPTDNGTIPSIVLLSQGTYTGTISVNNTTGVVSFSSAAPNGMHTIRIRATDNCGLMTDTSFTLTVSPGDVTAPVITYNPLPNTFSTTNPVLTATITDTVGVTGATIYFSVDGGAYSSNPCTISGGTSQNGTWDCIINGSTPFGSAVSYYVQAQDAAANVGSNPGAGATAPNLYTVGSATIPAGTYTNLSLSNNSTLSGSVNVVNNVELGGVVFTGNNVLAIGCNGTITGGGDFNYVVGNVSKDYCTPGSFNYPVGTQALLNLGNASEYSPFTANVTALATIPSTLTVSVTDNFLGGTTQTQSISRYWDVTETGDLTADISYVYRNEDVNGLETGYQVLRREAMATATYPGGTVNDVTKTVTAPGVTNFSGWSAGTLAPVAATVGVAGQVLTANGQGIRNANVMITGGSITTPRYVKTNTFGNYQFDELQVGETYVITVQSKKYTFSRPSIIINLSDSISDADFHAEER